MPDIVDPQVGFVSFQQAYRDGRITPAKCESHPKLYMLHDTPSEGVQRLTYVFIADLVVKAYAVYVLAQPLDGKVCFGVGYATDPQCRGQGLATEVVRASMVELEKGINPKLLEPGFYVEAIVSIDNLASQKVAARTLDDSPKETTDKPSGRPALHYVKLLGA